MQLFELFSSFNCQIILEPFREKSILNHSILIAVLKQYLLNFNTTYPFRNRFFKNYRIQAVLQLRIMHLRSLLKSLDFDQNDVYLVGISSGSVIASQLASEFPIKSTLAFAYPFLHPEYGLEKHGIKYVIYSNQSVFLFQAVHDAYSSPYLIMHMLLAKYFKIHYFDTDNEFYLNEVDAFRLNQLIQKIIS